jgi:rubrerythrin
MGLLRVAPTEQIRSMPELMAVALAMESEAAERYSELAEYMRRTGNPQTARVLDDLAAEERSHAEMVDRLSHQRIGKMPDLSDIRWTDWPEVFLDEDVGRSRIVTPYRMLSIAVRNEERAFAFWSYVSAHADDRDVRREAEQMAHEELVHVARLRKLRRLAFHAERRDALNLPQETDAFPGAAAASAAGLRDYFQHLADTLAARAHPAAELAAAIAQEEADHASRLGGGSGVSGEAPFAVESTETMLRLAISRLETAVEEYFAAAEAADDEETVELAQRLAQSAVRRLAELRDREPDLQRHSEPLG